MPKIKVDEKIVRLIDSLPFEPDMKSEVLQCLQQSRGDQIGECMIVITLTPKRVQV